MNDGEHASPVAGRVHAAAPTEDRYLMTRVELLDWLDVLLGGRVAEELMFGDISMGAQDDLQRATDMARAHDRSLRDE